MPPLILVRRGHLLSDQTTRTQSIAQPRDDPWHYVPVLARKPGALRNGAPFKDWVLPTSLARIRQKLGRSDDGDRQMVKILTTVLTDGLPAVEAACAEALDEGVHSADVILNILARHREVIQPLDMTLLFQRSLDNANALPT